MWRVLPLLVFWTATFTVAWAVSGDAPPVLLVGLTLLVAAFFAGLFLRLWAEERRRAGEG